MNVFAAIFSFGWLHLLLMVSVLLLTGCPSSFSLPPIKGDRNNQSFGVDYPYENRTRESIIKKCGADARACIEYHLGLPDYFTLYAEMPESLDDNIRKCLLGEEVLHMVHGVFHVEGEHITTCGSAYPPVARD